MQNSIHLVKRDTGQGLVLGFMQLPDFETDLIIAAEKKGYKIEVVPTESAQTAQEVTPAPESEEETPKKTKKSK